MARTAAMVMVLRSHLAHQCHLWRYDERRRLPLKVALVAAPGGLPMSQCPASVGAPKIAATRMGLLFTREFENRIRSMDCSTQTGSIEWKDWMACA